MAAKDEWILFLEKNPQFHILSKSGLYISLLKFVRTEALDMDKIHSAFARVEAKDLDLIIDSLLKLKLVNRIKSGPQVFFGITALGKKFLNVYGKARKGFSIE